MIVLDEPIGHVDVKRQIASSSRVDEYVDDTIPYTEQLDEALSTDIESQLGSMSSAASVSSSASTERTEPLPPSYEASIYNSREIMKGFAKRSRRRWLVPLAILFLYFAVSAVILIPWLAKRKPNKPKTKNHGPDFTLPPPWPPLMANDDISPSVVLPPPLPTNNPPIFSVPEIATTEECKSWKAEKSNTKEEDIPVHSVTFKFPAPKAMHLSNKSKREPRSAGSAGSLHVRLNENADETQIVMDVTAKFIGEKCKKEAEVCLHRSTPGAVVQFDVISEGSKNSKGWSPVLWDVVLTLPRTGKLHVQNLTTQLSFFEHNFDDLREFVTFDNIDIKGHFSPFGAKGLTARDIHVSTSVKSISGNFNVSNSLSLTTSLAPIVADVLLAPEMGQRNAVSFTLSTSNGPINGSFQLDRAMLTPGVKPRYSGMVTTANGPIYLAVAHTKNVPEATLHLMAETSLDPVVLYLDPKYQGGFDIKSKVASANVVGYDGVPDPLRLNRKRVVAFDERGAWGTTGWVGWNERPALPTGESHVEVSTELAEATLLLSEKPPV